jgi:hypothetical protein
MLQYKLFFQTGAEGTTEYFDHETTMIGDKETTGDALTNHIGLATGLLGSSSACVVSEGDDAVVRLLEVGETEETPTSKEIGAKPRCSTISHNKHNLLLLLLLPLYYYYYHYYY